MNSTFKRAAKITALAATASLTGCVLVIQMPPHQGTDLSLGPQYVPPDQGLSGSLGAPPSLPPLIQQNPVPEDPALSAAADILAKQLKGDIAAKCKVSSDVVERAQYVVGRPVRIDLIGANAVFATVMWKTPILADADKYLGDPASSPRSQTQYNFSALSLFDLDKKLKADTKLVEKPGNDCAKAGAEVVNIGLAVGNAVEKARENEKVPPLPEPLPQLPSAMTKVHTINYKVG